MLPVRGGSENGNTYTSPQGIVFSSNGAVYSNHWMWRMFDGNRKSVYLLNQVYNVVDLTVRLPRNMFIHHIRIYPVCIL